MLQSLVATLAEIEDAQTSLASPTPCFAQERLCSQLAPPSQGSRKRESVPSLCLLHVLHPLLRARPFKAFALRDTLSKDHLPPAWFEFC